MGAANPAERARNGSKRKRDIAALAAETARPLPGDVQADPVAAELWKRVLEAVRPTVPPSAFANWIAPVTFRGVREGCLVVAGPERAEEWVRRRYGAALGELIRADETTAYRGLLTYQVPPDPVEVEVL